MKFTVMNSGGGWRIEMLGGLRAVHGERTLARFPGKKAAALLAYLALSPGRFQSRETLAELLWPEVERTSQLHNLRLTLSRLRRLLAPDDALLDTDRLSVRLDAAALTTDVSEFERAIAQGDRERARALYTGPFLPGLYEDWILLTQTRLEALREQLDAPPEAQAETMRRPHAPRLPETLPLALTRFFGRETELETLKSLLVTKTRLITLTGLGGTGKTRLALEAARRRLPGSAHAFISLADLTDPSQLPNAIRQALRLPVPTRGFAVVELVQQELAALGPLLLILDNAEHLLQDGSLADFVVQLLTMAPSLRILVSSRRALEIPGEVVLALGPLTMETRMTLFLDRARAARPELQGSPQTLATTREICRRLEGIPLALELAAAHASVLSVPQILEGIERRLEFLTTQHQERGVPRRHRSLRAALRSSYELLSPKLQCEFAQLSVFRGDFTAEAADTVADAHLETLDALLRWSLLTSVEQPDGSLRFRMLETVRTFGQECLTEQEQRELSQKHAQFFCEWAEANRVDDAPTPLPDQATRLARQDAEQDNVRLALTFCSKSKHVADHERGLRLVSAFWTFWYIRNASQELETWATRLLSLSPATPRIRARALLTLGLAVREQGDLTHFAALVEEALATLEAEPEDRHLALGLHLRGLAAMDQHRFADSEQAYTAAESLWERLGDRRNAATTRHNRALLALEQQDLPRAEALCAQVLAVFREWHEKTWVASSLLTQAGIRAERGDLTAATRDCIESSTISQQTGYVRGEAQAERDACRYLVEQQLWSAATEHGRQALALFRKVGDRHGEATALAYLAQALLQSSTVESQQEAQSYQRAAEKLQAQHQWASLETLLAGLPRVEYPHDPHSSL